MASPARRPACVGGRTRLHLLDADGTGKKLRQKALFAQVEVIVFGRGGHVKAQLQGLAAALHRNRYVLVGVQLEAIEDFFPVRIVVAGKAAKNVARLNAGLGSRGAWR